MVIQVNFEILSFTINNKAELRTVFKIWACKPLKKPDIPSLPHIAEIAANIVLGDLDFAFLGSSSWSAAWIMTLHLYMIREELRLPILQKTIEHRNL